jgi:hypothetical protein
MQATTQYFVKRFFARHLGFKITGAILYSVQCTPFASISWSVCPFEAGRRLPTLQVDEGARSGDNLSLKKEVDFLKSFNA